MLLAAQQLADLVGRLSVVLFYGVRVDVHGGCRHAAAEPVLHGLDVRPVADEERRLGVTKVVELQPLVVRPLDAGDSARINVPDRAPLPALRCRQSHVRADQDKCAHQGCLGVQQRRHLLMWPTQRNS